MAKDLSTRQAWLEDDDFLQRFSKTSHSNQSSSPKLDFLEAERFYRIPRNGYAFFHRAVKVKGNKLT